MWGGLGGGCVMGDWFFGGGGAEKAGEDFPGVAAVLVVKIVMEWSAVARAIEISVPVVPLVVFRPLFAEGEGAFLEVEAFGGDLLVEVIFIDVASFLAEVEGDFMDVHFAFPGMRFPFPGMRFALALLTVGTNHGGLFTKRGAFREIGEALEGEKLGGGVVAGADAFHG